LGPNNTQEPTVAMFQNNTQGVSQEWLLRK